MKRDIACVSIFFGFACPLFSPTKVEKWALTKCVGFEILN